MSHEKEQCDFKMKDDRGQDVNANAHFLQRAFIQAEDQHPGSILFRPFHLKVEDYDWHCPFNI